MRLKRLLSMRQVTPVFLVVCIFSLSACVSVTPTIPVTDTDQAWKTHSNSLYQQQQWLAHLTLIGVNQQQKFKVRAIWQQQDDHYTIKLRDFIGRTVAVIEGSPEGVQAKTSKGQSYTGNTAEELIVELFDMQIPVAGMRYWLLGVPKPNVELDRLELNQVGVADLLGQEGWLMSYADYSQSEAQAPTQSGFI